MSSMWQWNAKEEETYRRGVDDKLESIRSTLDSILTQTTATNGRITSAEKMIERLKTGYFIGAAVFGAVLTWALNTWGPGK